MKNVMLSLQQAPLMSVLIGRLEDTDEEVRMNACVALQYVVKQPLTHSSILNSQFWKPVFAALDDTCTDVVVEALNLCCAIHLIFNESSLSAEFLRAGAVKKYIQKINSASEEISNSAACALECLLDIKEAFVEIIENGAVRALVQRLHPDFAPGLLTTSQRVIAKIAFFSMGKKCAVDESAIAHIVPLLKHENADVRNCAAEALVALTITEDGKVQAIKNGAVEQLIESLANEQDVDILVGLARTAVNIAEHPEARKNLSAALPRLSHLVAQGMSHPTLTAAVQRAIAAIQWLPFSE